MFNFSKEPQTPAGVLLDSFSLYKYTFSRIWRWQLLWLLPLLLLTSPQLAGNFSLLATQAQGLNAFSTTDFILSIIGTLILIYGETFILHRMQTLAAVDPAAAPTPITSLKMAGKKFFPVIGGFILNNLVILACLLILMLVIGVILLLVSLVAKTATFSPSALSISAIGVLALVWIVVGTYLCLVNVLILLDNWPVVKSLKQSFYLVKGRWWATFVVLLIPLAFGFVINQLVNLVLGLVISPPFPIANVLVNILADTIIYPWIAAVFLVQFHDLKVRKHQPLTHANVVVPSLEKSV